MPTAEDLFTRRFVASVYVGVAGRCTCGCSGKTISAAENPDLMDALGLRVQDLLKRGQPAVVEDNHLTVSDTTISPAFNYLFDDDAKRAAGMQYIVRFS
jgi:hypothetical protein